MLNARYFRKSFLWKYEIMRDYLFMYARIKYS